jgi:fructokinase
VRTDDPTTLALAETGEGGSVARYRFYAQGTYAAGSPPRGAGGAARGRRHGVRGDARARARADGERARAVVDRLRPAALVAVDPNRRPDVIRDPAAYRRRLRWMLERTDVVKASEADRGWLDPGRDRVEPLRALLADGPSLGLLTRGGDGAVVVAGERAVEVTPPPVTVVDTIGAGDAFAGGFLAWWRERGLGAGDLADLDAAVEGARFACLVAARTCARAGASPPHRGEL